MKFKRLQFRFFPQPQTDILQTRKTNLLSKSWIRPSKAYLNRIIRLVQMHLESKVFIKGNDELIWEWPRSILPIRWRKWWAVGFWNLIGFKTWKSRTQVTNCELLVQLYQLQVQIHEFRVQIHELQAQIHALQVQIHNLWVQILKIGD